MIVLAAESAHTATFPIAPALILVPVLTAVVIAFIGANRAAELKATALLGSSITGAMSLWMLGQFDKTEAGLQFVTRSTWVEDLGLQWFFGIDGISLFLVVLSGVLFPIAILTTDHHHDPKPYYLWLMILMAGSALGALLGVGIAIPLVLASVAVNMLEIFVAFLQAFIFTYLTTLFIGMSVNVHYDDHGEAGAH